MLFYTVVENIEHMKKDDSNKQLEKFPVREGTGDDGSGLKGKTPPVKGKYPLPEVGDVQANNQPEYTEEQPNRTSPNTAANPE